MTAPARAGPYPGGPPERLQGDEPEGRAHPLADEHRLAAAVDAAARGEEAGWNHLFDRFHTSVHAYALARLGDRAAAEEVTQEVFVAAVRSIGGLRERREPAVQAWFLHICRHKVADHFRRRARDRGERRQPPPDVEDPESVLEARALAGEVRAAMSLLTDDQRDILVRRFVLDQSLEQVAAATGRSVGAVKSMQHRALAAMGRRLAAESAA